jgi:hypothetical protein
MNIHNNGFCIPRRTRKFGGSLLCAAFILFVASKGALGSGEAALAPLDNLNMGISSSAVIDKIKSVGTNSLEPSPWDKRKKIIWRLPENSNYDSVMFLFTEKDRLYLVRFIVKKEAWSEARNLKKALFQQFGISSDAPARTKIKDQDILMHGGLKQDYSFFEYTDNKTGGKAFELYSGKVSQEDKPKKEAEDKSHSQK